jgi:serine protease AprX
MRYAIISKGLSLPQIQAECHRLGARNIKVAPVSEQVFCDLEEEAAARRLGEVPGLAVKPVGKVYTDQVGAPQAPELGAAIYAGSQAALSSLFYQARASLDPPALGAGFTIAVLDSGIRKTHRSLQGKVVYEVDLVGSGTTDDEFDHGTGVAFLAAGGRHAPGEESGFAPAAKLMNIKVLDAAGEGTTESVVMGLEEVYALKQQALKLGLPPEEPLYPNTINMSFGAPDDGDPDNPIRVAARQATDLGLGVVAAAGNAGPSPGTIMLPAADAEVFAVGALTFVPFQVWSFSSRGPTREEIIKPDVVFFGVDMLTASSKSDTAFEVKSGTSFAAPCLAGGAAVGQEMVSRILGTRVGSKEAMGALQVLSRKPQGAPAEKDNDYGWGMPSGDLFLRALRGGVAPQVMESVLPVLGLGMLGMLTTGMMRSMREPVRRR